MTGKASNRVIRKPAAAPRTVQRRPAAHVPAPQQGGARRYVHLLSNFDLDRFNFLRPFSGVVETYQDDHGHLRRAALHLPPRPDNMREIFDLVLEDADEDQGFVHALIRGAVFVGLYPLQQVPADLL